MNSAALALPEIPALVLRGHREQPWASVSLWRVEGDAAAGRAALRELAAGLTWASDVIGEGAPRPPLRRHLALSSAGLRALGVPARVLATFPPEFVEGMGTPARTRRLGDRGPSDPSTWHYGAEGTEPHALLAVYASTKDALGREVGRLRERLSPALALIADERSEPRLDGKEHFGFADGMSQPIIAGDPTAEERAYAGRDVIATGEFLLGYANEYGKRPVAPTDGGLDLGDNGSFLVYRKLEQDVAGFWAAFSHGAARLGKDATWLASRAVGRWPSGAPVSLCPDADDPALGTDPQRNNLFGYADDRYGLRCPIGAHARRANPRDGLFEPPEDARRQANRRRLLRRGRSYGPPVPDRRSAPPVEGGRGLLFLALCANIQRQFEFVQQTWLSSRKFGGLGDDADLVSAHGDRPTCLTIPGAPFRERVPGLASYVHTRGGGYFFLAGRRALVHLLADENVR